MGKGLASFSIALLLGACLAFLSASPAQAQVGQANPSVIRELKHDVSPPLRNLPSSVQAGSGADQQQLVARPTGPARSNSQSDPVAQQLTAPLSGVSTILNFDGQSAQDNRNVLGFAFVPPDTNGAVGATQFVQIVNVTIAVYDKSSGALQFGPRAIHTLWTGFGGLCEFGGGTPTFADGGDPVVLYDHLAGRWLVTQLQYNTTFTQTAQCVAVSTNSDASCSYNRYEFDFGSNFPDYPKFGIWPDAYYSASSHDLDPSVFVVGRAPSDPAGTMAGPLVLVNGGGVQENSFRRWGDYSSMAIDPGDDCTFWYTQEYYKTSGSFNWSTRISAFKFDSCKAHGK